MEKYSLADFNLKKRPLYLQLEEQNICQFNGKVFLLDRLSKKQLGEIIFYQGEIIYIEFKGNYSIKSLSEIFRYDIESDELSIIIVPEVVDGNNQLFNIKFNELIEHTESILKEAFQTRHLRPPENLKLQINIEIFFNEQQFSGLEFDLLCTICEFSQISDVYQNSAYGESLITSCLVSLRKKQALLVIEA